MKLQKDREELQMLSKRGQSEKATCIIPTLWYSGKGKSVTLTWLETSTSWLKKPGQIC